MRPRAARRGYAEEEFEAALRAAEAKVKSPATKYSERSQILCCYHVATPDYPLSNKAFDCHKLKQVAI